MKKYQIVTTGADSLSAAIDKMNKNMQDWLKDGWQTSGGITVFEGTNHDGDKEIFVMQVIVR